uniref:Uncharacterized protein n=1 Tax=Palpitomonas bilix TaxID=652834 RepID=A0A7S3GEB2_9EUKA|mmetsp:Transcript_4572/g.9475  ORF Transcript_4572/g.9475 Transcript_4572/m.9475 type:complete len:112 (+) Transcript_4572:31-366(+)
MRILEMGHWRSTVTLSTYTQPKAGSVSRGGGNAFFPFQRRSGVLGGGRTTYLHFRILLFNKRSESTKRLCFVQLCPHKEEKGKKEKRSADVSPLCLSTDIQPRTLTACALT